MVVYVRVAMSSLILLLSARLIAQSTQMMPHVNCGQIIRLENFSSKYVDARNIDIWLPPGYNEKERYGVIYMQDGQNLFDPALTWNKRSWEMDDTASVLFKEENMRNCIVVGIWNSGKGRYKDYFPQKPFEMLAAQERDSVSSRLNRAGRASGVFSPESDQYLMFITEELKPYIDARFSVHRNRKNTFIGGSSAGALISWYAVCEYPGIFGGALCLSTHWTGVFTANDNPVPGVFLKYLEQHLPSSRSHRFYFGCGDRGLDSIYVAFQMRVDSLMQQKGYAQDSWQTVYFQGADHSESSWTTQLRSSMVFLLNERRRSCPNNR
jgi:predicted alpha/beta superfamily hydrolase